MDFICSFDYYTESWIEVSSQPSSSSLSSATDEIVTTGLRVQHDSKRRQRRRPQSLVPTHADISDRPTSAAGSSQEEYEESESESDRAMNSSTEGLQPRDSRQESNPSGPPSSGSEDVPSDVDEDDDGNSTALGITNNEPVFTPQPNAFSHPPVSQPGREVRPTSVPNSYFPTPRAAPTRSPRHSYPNQRTRSHTPYNMISPSYQVDHDAALRASLSTLLSCAAAARGLPKSEQTTANASGASNRIEPSTLRMVPESVALGEDTTMHRTGARQRSTTSSSSPSVQDKGKRKASTSKDSRETRKKRRANIDEMMISPTLMTWVVSAGVVVLFSAISFSAGYAIGKEVGRVESGLGTGVENMACGKEVGRGLRKLRWTPTPTVPNV